MHLFLATPPSPSPTSCSILPSPGGAEVFLQWSPSFTAQHAVERYRVSVTLDPSSCSSDQVSPNEDYSCSGLVVGTPYTFTFSAINCGNQEGNRKNYTIYLGKNEIIIMHDLAPVVKKWSVSQASSPLANAFTKNGGRISHIGVETTAPPPIFELLLLLNQIPTSMKHHAVKQ